jgi:hypothetical protein
MNYEFIYIKLLVSVYYCEKNVYIWKVKAKLNITKTFANLPKFGVIGETEFRIYISWQQ